MVETYKVFFDPHKVVTDSLRLARLMHEKAELDTGTENYTPNAFVGIWRGGTTVAAPLTGALKGYGYKLHTHSASGKSYNEGASNQSQGIEIYNMEELMRHFRRNRYDTVCGVDDVFDSGRTWHSFHHIMRNGLQRVDAVAKEDGTYLFPMHAENDDYMMKVLLDGDIEPLDKKTKVLMATPYWKPHANRTELRPDFFVQPIKPDFEGRWPWIVFYYEGPEDLTRQELYQNFPEYWDILHG